MGAKHMLLAPTTPDVSESTDSLYFLALLKLYGISVTPDEAMALGLMRKAAEQRHPEAIVALGMMLLHGRGKTTPAADVNQSLPSTRNVQLSFKTRIC